MKKSNLKLFKNYRPFYAGQPSFRPSCYMGLKMANYGGHAVTFIRFDGEWLDVKDDPNNQIIKVHRSEVVKIFKAAGLRTN